jgi:hypothetical protein
VGVALVRATRASVPQCEHCLLPSPASAQASQARSPAPREHGLITPLPAAASCKAYLRELRVSAYDSAALMAALGNNGWSWSSSAASIRSWRLKPPLA